MAIPEENRSRGLRWYYTNKDKARSNHRAWYARMREHDPEYCTARSRQRRHTRRAAGASLKRADLVGISRSSDGICSYCLRPAVLVLEHCTPLSRGGGNTIENCVMACAACNGRKGTKTVLEFLLGIG